MKNQEKIDFPIHFVVPDHLVWPELMDGGNAPIDGKRLSELSGGILNSWVLRTCYHLRQAGVFCTISSEGNPAAVNVFSARDYGRKQRRPDIFALVPRGDAHRTLLADFIVNQNGLRPNNASEDWVPHWPQPGILPRDASRAARIETIVFKGRKLNLDAAFRSKQFERQIDALGLQFTIDSIDTLTGPHSWNDYRAADVVLAVRNLTRYDAAKKPASKLVNAWFADVPAMLGPEPAFRELKKSSLDFMEVRTPTEAIKALEALKENPTLYLNMIENGRRRCDAFAADALTQRWIYILANPVRTRFLEWQRQKRLLRLLKISKGLLLEPVSKKVDKYRTRKGKRILDY